MTGSAGRRSSLVGESRIDVVLAHDLLPIVIEHRVWLTPDLWYNMEL
jgi:hypothetical protein